MNIWDVVGLGVAFALGFVAGLRWLARRVFRHDRPVARGAVAATEGGSGDGGSGDRVPRRPRPRSPSGSIAMDRDVGNHD